MTTIQDRIIKDFNKQFLKIYPDGETRFLRGLFIEDIEQFLIQSIKEVEEETRKEIIEIIKHHSANLPIDIERQGGLYAQGMHSGIDLCIDEILSITNKEKEK